METVSGRVECFVLYSSSGLGNLLDGSGELDLHDLGGFMLFVGNDLWDEPIHRGMFQHDLPLFGHAGPLFDVHRRVLSFADSDSASHLRALMPVTPADCS